ncbi:DDE-type integrase/transposase/recombinase, partial [Acinetobacter pittii]
MSNQQGFRSLSTFKKELHRLKSLFATVPIEKRLRWYWRNPTDLSSWHIDETYVKVNGRWSYLYRAVD